RFDCDWSSDVCSSDLHQFLGLATWAGLAATEVVGQLDLNDKYRGGGDTGRYQTLHLSLALSTTALFSAVGLLGVFAPVPFEKKRSEEHTSELQSQSNL